MRRAREGAARGVTPSRTRIIHRLEQPTPVFSCHQYDSHHFADTAIQRALGARGVQALGWALTVQTDGTRAIVEALISSGWTFVASVPDKAVASLLEAVSSEPRIIHVPCTREEEAVGLCAGAAFGGRRGVLITQNSGIGNAVNALTSLIGFYDLPLLMLVSQRGGADERISAQLPMGRATRPILEACGVLALDVSARDELLEAIARAQGKRVAAIGEPAAWSRILE